jgi:hypothetical protein
MSRSSTTLLVAVLDNEIERARNLVDESRGTANHHVRPRSEAGLFKMFACDCRASGVAFDREQQAVRAGAHHRDA